MGRLVDFAWLFGIGGLIIAGFIFLYISRQPDGNDKMRDIAKKIHEGAMAYLRRQYTILAVFIIIMINTANIVYCLLRYAIAPSCIFFAISLILSFPSGCLLI